MSWRRLEHGFDAAIVPPCWVWAARDELRGTVARIGSIVDYPNGSAVTSVRVAEVKALVDSGVDELDATVNVGYLLSGRVQEFAADIAAVVAAAEPVGVKLMLELPLLDARQREQAVRAAIDAGAAFVSIASSGSVGIADPATIAYLRRSVPASIGVKASGGVKTVRTGPGAAHRRRRPDRHLGRDPHRHRCRHRARVAVFVLTVPCRSSVRQLFRASTSRLLEPLSPDRWRGGWERSHSTGPTSQRHVYCCLHCQSCDAATSLGHLPNCDLCGD